MEERPLKWRAGVVAALACCLALFGRTGTEAAEGAGVPHAEPNERTRILFPADRCVLESGALEVLAVLGTQDAADPPAVLVDGEPHPWKSYKLPVAGAQVTLEPGEHRVSVGKWSVTVFVAEKDGTGPEDWPVFRSHPGKDGPWKDCAACHETQEESGRMAVGAWKGAEACGTCHDSVLFAEVHAHTEGPLEDCQTCHAIHGSPRPALLTAPAQKLCTKCHD